MKKVSDVLAFLNTIAPMENALGFDNVGLLVGNSETEVKNILIALDITKDVIEEAKEIGADLIVAHHPVIFEPLKAVVSGNTTADHVISLIENKISAICMHTNLDAAIGGVNDTLAEKIGILPEGYLEPINDVGIGRYGNLEKEMNFADFTKHMTKALKIRGFRYLKANDTVKRVAVGGGSCGGMLSTAVATGCDTFITADIKHSVWLEAREKGINLIDAGHFSTENVVVEQLYHKLSKEYPQISVAVSKRSDEPMLHFNVEEAE